MNAVFDSGRGGGYYDRLIPSLRPDATCWSICFECQLVPELPVEAHDAPLTGVPLPVATFAVSAAAYNASPSVAKDRKPGTGGD